MEGHGQDPAVDGAQTRGSVSPAPVLAARGVSDKRCQWCGLEDHAGNCPIRRVHEVSARWRDLARVWDKQERESYWPSAKGVQQPPQRGRAAIRNWINWLNSCAAEIDAALEPPR